MILRNVIHYWQRCFSLYFVFLLERPVCLTRILILITSLLSRSIKAINYFIRRLKFLHSGIRFLDILTRKLALMTLYMRRIKY